MLWISSAVVAAGLFSCASDIAACMLGRIVVLCLSYLFLDSVFCLSLMCRGAGLW